MTKHRPPLTIEQALTNIAARIGWPEMAHVCGEKESTVRAWGDPAKRGRCPVDAGVKLDLAFAAAGGDGAPIYETYGLILEAQRAERFSGAAAIAAAAMKVIKEGGEAHVALVRASSPSATTCDLTNAKREVEEAVAELTRTLPLLADGAGPDSGSGEGSPRGGAK